LAIDQNERIDSDRYQLIDFGNGRKLESLAGHIVDRPSPAAEAVRPQLPAEWSHAASRFDPIDKSWSHHQPWPSNLEVDCVTFRMPVAPTPFGHIGLFPEQQGNWQWLSLPVGCGQQQRTALNLFAYTGASTMALVAAGFQVAHVDAAKPNVQAARQAAARNGWSDAPIRYLVDDAAKFLGREVRRQRTYHTVVLDPPAFGHSPQGKTWRIERDLWPLVDDCLKLMDPVNFRLLITGHSKQIDRDDVCRFLKDTDFFRQARGRAGLLLTSGRSQLMDRQNRPLDAGFYIRASSPSPA